MKSIFIAEVGINHHGNIVKAKEMASKALDAGADYIKYQFYNPVKVLGRTHPAFDYAQQCYFTRQQHEEIKRYCDSIGAKYLLSVFTVGDVGWADTLCSAHKIASRMNRDAEFIAVIERRKKLTFMSVQPEVDQRIPERFKLMWCIRNYPSTKEDVLSYPYRDIGLSSHCPDYTASVEAYHLGCRLFENHVCESREEEGCDISSSLTFEEYRKLIKSCAS